MGESSAIPGLWGGGARGRKGRVCHSSTFFIYFCPFLDEDRWSLGQEGGVRAPPVHLWPWPGPCLLLPEGQSSFGICTSCPSHCFQFLVLPEPHWGLDFHLLRMKRRAPGTLAVGLASCRVEPLFVARSCLGSQGPFSLVLQEGRWSRQSSFFWQ